MGFLVGFVNPWFWRGRGSLGKGVWGSVWTLPCGITPIQTLSEPPDADCRNAPPQSHSTGWAPRPRGLSTRYTGSQVGAQALVPGGGSHLFSLELCSRPPSPWNSVIQRDLEET